MKLFLSSLLFLLSLFIEAKAEDPSLKLINRESAVDSLIYESNQFLQDDLQNSLEYALIALENSLKTNDKNDLLSAYSQLGKVYYYIGMNNKCFTNWQKARELAIEISDEKTISNITFNLVALLIAVKEYDKAQNYLNQVKPYYFSNNEPEFMKRQLSVINNQAIIYQNQGLTKQAKKSFEQGLTVFYQLEDKISNLSFLNAYSFFLIDQKNFSLAIEILDQIKQINAENENYSAQIDATIQFRYAVIYNILNEKENLHYHLKKGLKIAKSINSISLLKEFNYLAYTIHKAEKNAGKALLFKDSYDSLFNLEQVNEAKLAIIQNELEQKYGNYKNQLKNEALKNKKQKRIIYSTSLFILILLFLFIYRLKKQKKEKSYAQSNIYELKKKVEIKEKEVVTLGLKQIHQRAVFEKIIADIKSNTSQINALTNNKNKSDALSKESKALWNEFELRFNQVENNFYLRLEKINQELTKNERRLCALLFLDFSTKEIAQINNQSIRSVEIARIRVRKKLNLTNSSINLNTFLNQL